MPTSSGILVFATDPGRRHGVVANLALSAHAFPRRQQGLIREHGLARQRLFVGFGGVVACALLVAIDGIAPVIKKRVAVGWWVYQIHCPE